MSLGAWLRNIVLLRDPLVLRGLAGIAAAEAQLHALRSAYPGVKFGHDLVIQGWPEGSMSIAAGVSLGKGSVICLGDRFNGLGELKIGEGTWIGQYNNLRLGGESTLSIGAGCLISQFCSVVTANHRLDRHVRIKDQPVDARNAGVVLGDDVWLGAGASVMPGVSIGSGAVIGAGSVVTRSVPEFEIWAGVPARKVSERT